MYNCFPEKKNERGPSLVDRFWLVMSVQETFFLSWLLWSAQYKIFFSFIVHFFNLCVPFTQQPGQSVVQGRLSLYVCLRCKLSTDKLTQAGCYLLFSLLLGFFLSQLRVESCLCLLIETKATSMSGGLENYALYDRFGLDFHSNLSDMFPKVDCDG
jgi:hypothetical protein